MDDGDVLVEYSDSQVIDNDDYKCLKLSEHGHTNYFQHRDDHSDIYFERNYGNEEDLSHCAVSNYNKEINLDVDQISDSHFFMEPKTPNYGAITAMKFRGRQFSRSYIRDPPECDTHNMPSDVEVDADDEMMELRPDQIVDAQPEQNIEPGNDFGSSGYENQYSQGDISYASIFNKNEGKLVFKITRFNKTTRKEKLITKNRRMISKCPHTSMKYYAKGMCKKCYHNFGREKKAFICGHVEKPLYAKGYCKQCYLSKYKEKACVNSDLSSISRYKKKQSIQSIPMSVMDTSMLKVSESLNLAPAGFNHS